MKRIDVSLGDRSYPIVIGAGALAETADTVLRIHRPTSVLVVPVGTPQGAGPTKARRRHSRTQAVAAHV